MKFFRKSMLTFLCFCLCANLAAQTPLIDSLKQILATDKLKNTEKAEILKKIADEYYSVDTEKSRLYAYESLKLVKDLGLKKEEAALYITLSKSYMFSDTEQQREYAVQALELAQKYRLKRIEGLAYFCLGVYYNTVMLPYQAHAHYIGSEKIFLELDDKKQLNAITNNLMIIFSNLKDTDNEIYYANKVLATATEPNDWRRKLTAQSVLGDALFRDNKNQEALDYFLNLYQEAIHIEDSLGIRADMSITLGSRCGDIYYSMKRFDEALPFFRQLHDYCQSTGNYVLAGLSYCFLSLVYSAMNNIDSAEYYVNKAKESPLIINFKKDLYFASAKVDSLKGDYLSALGNFQKFHHINDSLSKEEKTIEMSRIKLWHEFDQKEVEKRILQQEYQKQQKLTTTLAVALVMILALFALVVFFYRKIRENNCALNEKNRIITEKNDELKELHTVKDKLFSVVAHDLRNPMAALMSVLKLTHMNVLDAETQAQLFKDVSKQVEDVYGLLDNLLRWAKSQMQGQKVSPVTFDVQSEIRAVMDGFQETAAAKMVTLNSRVENQEIYADRDMFSVVVRNLVTNAIKYTASGGKVTIDSELSENMLNISVADTGIGMSKEIQDSLFKLSETQFRRGTNNENGSGLGLVLCADFVKANGGRIWFESTQGEGSTFFFSVPVKS